VFTVKLLLEEDLAGDAGDGRERDQGRDGGGRGGGRRPLEDRHHCGRRANAHHFEWNLLEPSADTSRAPETLLVDSERETHRA